MRDNDIGNIHSLFIIYIDIFIILINLSIEKSCVDGSFT